MAPNIGLTMAPDQPIETDIKLAEQAGIFVKSLHILKAGTIVPQHSHAHEHLTMIARGSVHAWRDGVSLGVFNAPTGILIPAETKHAFEALVDNTVLYCIHNVSQTGEVEIVDEHQIVEGTPAPP